MKLEYLILGQLTLNPCTGYSIKKYFDTEGRFGMATRPLSQIYTTLKRMYENGWVEYTFEHREDAPDLKIYSLIEKGRDYLVNYLESPMEYKFRYFESEMLWRIMYSHLVSPEVILSQLEEELDKRRKHVKKFRHRNRTVASTLISKDQLETVQYAHDRLHLYGVQGLDAYIVLLEEWIDHFSSKIERLQP